MGQPRPGSQAPHVGAEWGRGRAGGHWTWRDWKRLELSAMGERERTTCLAVVGVGFPGGRGLLGGGALGLEPEGTD